MTDKEKIIIDGVDVSGCIFLDIVNERLWCDNVNIRAIGKSQCPYVDCFKNPDCYYKQLARKTQECEELKAAKIILMEAYVKRLRAWAYCKKALEEIKRQSKINCEEICGKNYDTCNDKDCLTKQIMDIISKAKENKQ